MQAMRRRDVLAGLVLPVVQDGPGLAEVAASRGVVFGSEVLQRELAGDAAYAALVARDCAVLVPGWEAKWDHVEPAEGRFDFAALDWIFDWAARHRMGMRLHTLVWALALPGWVKQALAAGRGEAVLRAHVAMLAGRYAGRVLAWDVVNEPTDPRWHLGPEGLTLNPWRVALGAGYVPLAFGAARRADATARLFLNDDDLEYDEPDREEKRTTYLRLLEGWLRAGVPVQGFGLQAHLKPQRRMAEAAYRRFLSELAGMGLELHITELDVQDHALPADLARRDAAIADTCRRYLDIVLDEPAVRAVVTWGLSARYTYMNSDGEVRRADGLEPRGMLYDAALRPTPMRAAVMRALLAAPKR